MTVRADDVRSTASRLSARADVLRSKPVREVAAALGRVGARFSDDDDALRRRALDELPESAGLSGPMARAVVDGMARDWTREAIDRLLGAEFEDPSVLDGFATVRGRRLTAVGPRLCVQVLAGSVPGVGVGASIRSLLVKAPTLVKLSRGDALLPSLFAEGLAAEAPWLSECLGMERWAGSDEASTRAAVESAEVVVVYGSDRTVDAIRAATPATTRFVGYHHRFGIAAVGADALAAGSLARTADGVAFAASMFDQRGCVSTQVVFVEAGTTPLERFADEVAEALARMERRLPSAPVLEGRSSALQQLRGTAELLAHAGSGYVRHGAGDGPWTVVVESEDGPPLPNAGRMIRLRPFADLDELVACLAPWAEHLQTLGVAGFGDRTEEVALRCGRAGVARVTNLEAIPFPAPEWLHDGRGPLRELVRWVERAWEG